MEVSNKKIKIILMRLRRMLLHKVASPSHYFIAIRFLVGYVLWFGNLTIFEGVEKDFELEEEIIEVLLEEFDNRYKMKTLSYFHPLIERYYGMSRSNSRRSKLGSQIREKLVASGNPFICDFRRILECSDEFVPNPYDILTKYYVTPPTSCDHDVDIDLVIDPTDIESKRILISLLFN